MRKLMMCCTVTMHFEQGNRNVAYTSPTHRLAHRRLHTLLMQPLQ